jgi:hypothetical protein
VIPCTFTRRPNPKPVHNPSLLPCEPVRVKKMRRKISEKKEKKGIDKSIDFETDGSFVIHVVWSFMQQSDF